MIGINLANLQKLLLKHNVPEEKAKSAMRRFGDLHKELARIHRRVKAVGDVRTANLALREIREIMRQADNILAEVLDEAKHENMSNSYKEKKKQHEHKQYNQPAHDGGRMERPAGHDER